VEKMWTARISQKYWAAPLAHPGGLGVEIFSPPNSGGQREIRFLDRPGNRAFCGMW
jgi:hypothetical protein